MDKTIPETPEAIAYKLMQDIFICNHKLIKLKDTKYQLENSYTYATEQDILDTYKKCLTLVKYCETK